MVIKLLKVILENNDIIITEGIESNLILRFNNIFFDCKFSSKNLNYELITTVKNLNDELITTINKKYFAQILRSNCYGFNTKLIFIPKFFFYTSGLLITAIADTNYNAFILVNDYDTLILKLPNGEFKYLINYNNNTLKEFTIND